VSPCGETGTSSAETGKRIILVQAKAGPNRTRREPPCQKWTKTPAGGNVPCRGGKIIKQKAPAGSGGWYGGGPWKSNSRNDHADSWKSEKKKKKSKQSRTGKGTVPSAGIPSEKKKSLSSESHTPSAAENDFSTRYDAKEEGSDCGFLRQTIQEKRRKWKKKNQETSHGTRPGQQISLHVEVWKGGGKTLAGKNVQNNTRGKEVARP